MMAVVMTVKVTGADADADNGDDRDGTDNDEDCYAPSDIIFRRVSLATMVEPRASQVQSHPVLAGEYNSLTRCSRLLLGWLWIPRVVEPSRLLLVWV